MCSRTWVYYPSCVQFCAHDNRPNGRLQSCVQFCGHDIARTGDCPTLTMPAVDPKVVGKELLHEPVKRVNNVTKLLKLVATDSDEAACRAAAHYLKLFFLSAFERGDVGSRPVQQATLKAVDAQIKLAGWLQHKFDAFTAQLQSLLQSQHSVELQVFALSVLLELVRGQQTGTFSQALFASTADVLLSGNTVLDDTVEAFKSNFLKFADVRFYTLRAIHNISQDGAAAPATDCLAKEGLGQRLFTVLTTIAPALQEATDEVAALPSWCGATEAGVVGAAPDRAEGSQQRRKRKRERESQEGAAPAPLLGGVQWANPAAYKRAFSDAWLGLLRLPLPSQLLKQVLVQLHTSVMPALPNPLLLADFLTSCLDQGGMLGILALNSIFTLVTKHGLEYPAFYARLYALLQAPVFRAKYRARFLQLTDIFLSSGMVPAYTAAAFIKKFARLALTAPPAGAIIAIAFIHNLLRRHPSCSVLVHRPAAKSQAHTSTMPAAQNSMQPLSDRSGQATQNGHATANAQNGVQSNPPGKPLASPSVAANPHAQQNGVPAYAVATSSDSDSDADDDKSSSEAAAEQAAATRVPAAKADRGNQSATNGLAEGSVGEDVYDDTELDPAKSRAIESSLWEIDSLRQHYYHTVATYVSILDRDLGDRKKTAEVDVTALLKSSYSSLMTLETEKRLKSVPVAFYPNPPMQLFPEAGKADFPGWVL